MKIGIISDIHANIEGLKSVLNKLKDVDTILCAGDIVGYYTFVNEVIDLIREKNIQCILGNHDAYLLGLIPLPVNSIVREPIEYAKRHITKENLNFLKAIGKTSFELTIDNCTIKMYHGSPWDEFEEYIHPNFDNFEKFKAEKADVVVLGHTHYPMEKRIGKMLIINPGSCGQPRDYNPKASYAILDTKTMKVEMKRVAYNLEKISAQAQKEGFDDYVVQVLKRTK